MEVRPGVFLSNVNTDRWQPDPDVPGSEMHELVHEGPLWAGLTRITDALEPTPWAPDQRETAIVLEGSVRIEFSDGPDVVLSEGDLISIPAGLPTTWHVTTPFKSRRCGSWRARRCGSWRGPPTENGRVSSSLILGTHGICPQSLRSTRSESSGARGLSSSQRAS